MIRTPGYQENPDGDLLRTDSISAALSMLYRALCYSINTKRNVWDFSIELADFRAANLFSHDLRWLVAHGFVAHAQDISKIDEPVRRFLHIKNLSIPENSCFILTQKGAELIASKRVLPTKGTSTSNEPNSNAHRPSWNLSTRELSMEGLLIKRFKNPAPNQEKVLSTFEEENWPLRIDDPLPPSPDLDCRRRLIDTIKYLNRNQVNRLLRFRGDGKGNGILWQTLNP